MLFALATSVIASVVLTIAAPQLTGKGNGMAVQIAKHSRLLNTDRSVNIDALHAHITSVGSKISTGLANFEKNNGTVHVPPEKFLDRRGFDLGLTLNDEVWYGGITVGTPGTSFKVAFDTGSSDLFIPASSCDWTCNGHARYDPTASSTANDLDQIFVVDFGDGNTNTVSGEQYTDTVAIGPYTATGQTFGAAISYTPGLASARFGADGMMGMAFPSISIFTASPVLETLVSQGEITESVFSFKLAPPLPELFLGGYNTDMFTGTFTYVPVTETWFWQVNMDYLQANGETIIEYIDCILVTSASLIIATPDDARTLYDALNGTVAPLPYGENYYTFPCDSFPDISFSFGGTLFPISASALNLGPVTTDSQDCVSAIMGLDVGSPFWVIGDVFLKNVYTTFDIGGAQVGFARLS